ncbi:MAG: protein-glutamate methylesterase/protein-glutamine glutaminase [Polyangiaceae bacterium]
MPALRTPVRVLVVDDSALVREVMQRVLGADESFSVTTAADAFIATRKIAASRPDVILLDLAMPRMDGLAFLRQLMVDDPIPVVICSVLTSGGADVAMRALDEGAVDVISKPRVGLKGVADEAVAPLADALRAAAQARVKRRPAAVLVPGPAPAPPTPVRAVVTPVAPSAHRGAGANTIVAIGASTGGTEALNVVLSALPHDAPGVVVVQHMPEGFTAAFANRLDGACRVRVREAVDGDKVERGLALIAPGGRHLVVRREGACYRARVVDGPAISRHKPSVDVLFRSVAAAAGPSAVGVLMTGMGRDGADGMAEMKQRGARTVAQDQASSVVFGMPKEAIALGVVDEVVSLSRIAAAILDNASSLGRVGGSVDG